MSIYVYPILDFSSLVVLEGRGMVYSGTLVAFLFFGLKTEKKFMSTNLAATIWEWLRSFGISIVISIETPELSVNQEGYDTLDYLKCLNLS